MSKDRLVNFRVPEKLYNDYKKFCEESSFTFSKRIRRLIELDLEKWRKYKRDQELNNNN
jgi:hypothetical protein